MGCDIHLYVEKRGPDGWELVTVADPSEFDLKYYPDEPSKWEWYNGRNYNLFAILADVRNDFGFKQVRKPRGLPSDATEAVMSERKEWGRDAHSLSWLTIDELLCFDWSQSVRHTGWIDAETYRRWRDLQGKKGGIYPRCKSVGGGRVRHLSNDEMDAFLADPNPNISAYTEIAWDETYAESAGEFLALLHGKLKALGNPADVRIVFWFDN